MIDGQIFQQTKKAMIDGQDGHSIFFGKESSPHRVHVWITSRKNLPWLSLEQKIGLNPRCLHG